MGVGSGVSNANAFPIPGLAATTIICREYYFEGLATLSDLTDDERREFFVRCDNFFV